MHIPYAQGCGAYASPGNCYEAPPELAQLANITYQSSVRYDQSVLNGNVTKGDSAMTVQEVIANDDQAEDPRVADTDKNLEHMVALLRSADKVAVEAGRPAVQATFGPDGLFHPDVPMTD